MAPDRTIAAGDGMNDREMLAWAALGVAMGNADAGTVAIADAVTVRVDQDGVVPVLRSVLGGPGSNSSTGLDTTDAGVS